MPPAADGERRKKDERMGEEMDEEMSEEMNEGARGKARRGRGRGIGRRMAEQMVAYFRETIRDGGIPTFSGAAELLGVSYRELSLLRERYRALQEAYAECRALLSDYLMQGGLTKRFDPQLVKKLLSDLNEEGDMAEDDEVRRLEVTVRVERGG